MDCSQLTRCSTQLTEITIGSIELDKLILL